MSTDDSIPFEHGTCKTTLTYDGQELTMVKFWRQAKSRIQNDWKQDEGNATRDYVSPLVPRMVHIYN